MNRWMANKLGLIDFWYYDFEEFELDEGKLLLRGTNGSGKSVTLQSFIPLLLDGNKAPSRIDPFGTTSRRIENYLLDEQTDEKTAYLYMEFKRQDTENYITIGMGLKAVRNKPLQSWYFGITDNRRVGKDLQLYREGHGRIALTKKQLENTIGTGGFYTESQKQYMAKVNELLFGFDTLDQYEELLDLLINVRSPKLSKDFKPTKIYDILQQSLKVLTEEDLRPMSEAMENMDSLVGRLEEYQYAREASEKINKYYQKYNEYLLKDKSTYTIEAYNKLKQIEKILMGYQEDVHLKTNQLGEIRQAYEVTNNLLVQVEKQYEELSHGEAIQIEKQRQALRASMKENDVQALEKEKQLEVKKDRDKELRHQLTGSEQKAEVILSEFKKELEDLEEITQNLHLEEAQYIHNELDREFGQCVFKPIYVSLEHYKEKLREAMKQILAYEKLQEDYNKGLEEKDHYKIEENDLLRESTRLEELFSEEKEDYKVGMNTWHQKNRFYQLESLSPIFRKVDEVENREGITELENSLKERCMVLKQDFNQRIFEHNQQVQQIGVQIQSVQEEIDYLKAAKLITPDRSQEVIAHRQRLENDNIAFMPLYETIDFNHHVSEEMKGAIEGALEALGILDALVIEPSDREKALSFETQEADKYIFSQGGAKAEPSILTYLKVDKNELKGIQVETVEQILEHIGLEGNSLFYLDEHGKYQLGPICGQAAQDLEAKYIGSSARKRHREMVIRDKETQVSQLQQDKEQVEQSIRKVQAQQLILDEEYMARPTTIHILEGIKLLEQNQLELNQVQKQLLKAEEVCVQLQRLLQEQKSKVFTAYQGLNMAHSSQVLQEELEGLEDFRGALLKVEAQQNQYQSNKEICQYVTHAIEDITQDIDNLYYEIHALKRQYNTWENEMKAIELTLEAMNIQDVQEEIEKCLQLKKSLPVQKEEQISRLSKLEEALEHLEMVIAQEVQKKDEAMKAYAHHLQILEKEYKLGYVEEPIDEVTIQLAKRLAKEQEHLKKTRDEYTNQLMIGLRDHSAPLREFAVQTSMIFEGEVSSRLDLTARIDGKEVAFKVLRHYINRSIEELQMLISDEERKVFEEVLMNTISTKITSKIYLSKQWVNKINTHMENMDTSSSLRLSLKWVPKKADAEDQLDIAQLLELLERGDRCSEEDFKKLARHFADKVKETIRIYEGTGDNRNYHTIIKEVLDYRNWYEFKLFFMKENKGRKELTNNDFFQFSGGEKAMSMYVPLFSAVYARYDSCRNNCPRIVAMDEAFAGVDENNIRDMFKILKELQLDYVLNSQALWGDYDTVEHLAISEIIRDPKDNTVFVMRYKWNGKERVLVD